MATLLATVSSPFVFFATFVIQLISSLLNDVLIPLCNVMFEWSTDYLTIPYVNTVILGLQAIAIVAVIAIRVQYGITSGILLSGGNKEASTGEFFYRTLAALVVVAAMPLLCNLVMRLGNLIFSDVVAGAGSMGDTMSWMTLGDNWDASKITGFSDQMITAAMWAIFGLLVMVVLTFAVGYQFVRRQVEMLTVSIIGPIVAVYYATEDDRSQVYDLLRKLFGLCCIMWLQYLLVKIALEFGYAWISEATIGNEALLQILFHDGGARKLMFCIAFFMAALTVPNLVEQFAFGNGGSRVGGVAVGAVVNKAFRGPKGMLPMGGR